MSGKQCKPWSDIGSCGIWYWYTCICSGLFTQILGVNIVKDPLRVHIRIASYVCCFICCFVCVCAFFFYVCVFFVCVFFSPVKTEEKNFWCKNKSLKKHLICSYHACYSYGNYPRPIMTKQIQRLNHTIRSLWVYTDSRGPDQPAHLVWSGT